SLVIQVPAGRPPLPPPPLPAPAPAEPPAPGAPPELELLQPSASAAMKRALRKAFGASIVSLGTSVAHRRRECNDSGMRLRCPGDALFRSFGPAFRRHELHALRA